MKVLLLGGFGFIGFNILSYLDKINNGKYSVVILDKNPKHPSGQSFKCIESVFCGDFSDQLLLEKILKSQNFDIIIHSLSTTIPSASFNERFDIETNLIPTVELLNLMVRHKQKKIVYISSGGAVYGDYGQNAKHKETDNNFPRSSYGVVKLAVEKYLIQYSSLYKIEPLILRLSNPYGPYHYSMKQGIINIALNAAMENRNINVWGQGDALKDYIYVEDFCRILFQLTEKKITNRILNIGSGQVLSLNQILSEIRELYPNFSWEYTSENIFDVKHFELDISELTNLIGDFSFTKFDSGLRLTNRWSENNRISKKSLT